MFWRTAFPVEYGLVDSLAKPARNVTGLAWFADEGILVKRLQLLRELAPHARRLASIQSASGPSALKTVTGDAPDFKWILDRLAAARREMGFEAHVVRPLSVADFGPAFESIASWAPDCLHVSDIPQTLVAKQRIVDFARRHKLIDVHKQREWVEAGGLFSYGIVVEPTLLRTAAMVDRILRGAKPADIPVELPHQYELIVNLAVARVHGFRIPQSILLRADRVIE